MIFFVSIAGLQRRFSRSLITIAGVVLAIAFLAYMLVTDTVTGALIRLQDDRCNLILQNAGIDIFTGGKTDQMMLLLIGLTIVTCTVGIVNVMLMSVTERIREIGTFKCLGATDRFIVKTYFVESVLQGLCGAFVGLVCGLVTALAVAFRTYGGFLATAFPARDILANLLTAFFIGSLMTITAAIIPAYIAARKQPVEALRVEE
jgi:ABC-type antimicrobial peptide transport system permease subunit